MINSLLVCSDTYPTPTDPAFSFVGQLCEEFSRQGVKVTVLAPLSYTSHLVRGYPLHPRKRVYNIEGGQPITVLQPYTLTFGMKFKRLNDIILKWVMGRAIRKYGRSADAFYAHFWHNGYRLYPFAKKHKKPLFVATGEETILLGRSEPITEKKEFAEYVKGVICVSSKNQNESLELGLTSCDKCEVYPNSIDNKLFRKLNKEELRKKYGYSNDDFIVAFVGWFIDRKGPQRVAAAISRLAELPIKSFFIGKASHTENIIPDCPGILYKGEVMHDNLPDFLNMADVFVLPTLSEGCCNAIIEAMACGLPIISSNLPFNWDVLNSCNSIMVDPQNVDEIALALKTLFEDRNKCQKMSIAALESAKELTLEKRAKKILGFISSRMS
ncbi:MAG: glycosyltransferase family 4 protein [Bacteroidaceae bacterium]|nr:glycosyltransferase family 4 protein [Bacteroidaceae bacterium]